MVNASAVAKKAMRSSLSLGMPAERRSRPRKKRQGGGTLLDDTGSHLARRLIKDSIHIDELQQAGYYGRVMELVADKMASFGV